MGAKKVYAVGIGPGGEAYMTAQARAAMEAADVICGYTVYVDLVKPLYPDKETYTTTMMKEIDRCRWAMEQADAGRTVAMVCSGDAGVYGMAGLLIQMTEQFPEVEVEVVSGITAALSGAAILGAPVGHDFCVISLSDLLTPWEVIEERLDAAGRGDFNVVLYNPRSKERVHLLDRACEIIGKYRSPETVCGWAKNIGREGEEKKIVTLAQLPAEPIDMFTTVFIGSSNTKVYGDQMVTPRGYEKK
jgi:precorrin-3B C17-methyltransferase